MPPRPRSRIYQCNANSSLFFPPSMYLFKPWLVYYPIQLTTVELRKENPPSHFTPTPVSNSPNFLRILLPLFISVSPLILPHSSIIFFTLFLVLFLSTREGTHETTILDLKLLLKSVVSCAGESDTKERLSRMSCNGCRILRKGCNENCILRESLQGIESSQAQANATIFVAKFFGRAGLMSFLSSVSQSERPALFQSLLFEACGRTVNPVNGAVGLLWTGNWNLCQSAVETVLRGGLPRPIPELFSGDAPADESTDVSDTSNINFLRSQNLHGARELKTSHDLKTEREQPIADLHLGLTQSFPARMTTGGRVNRRPEKRRAETPSENSEASETTTLESGSAYHRKSFKAGRSETKLLSLFV